MLQTVVIIGAGPAGLLLAHYLLRRGIYRIAIYEQRPDPRCVTSSQNRTFPISLQERGRKALRFIAGLEEAIAAQSVFCNGTIMHRNNGSARTIPRKAPILTIDRNRLVVVLLEQLVTSSPADRLTIEFGCRCIDLDPTAQTVAFERQGQLFTVVYDRLVGADGARSQVRQHLTHLGLQCDQTYVTDAYKSVFLSRTDPQTSIALEGDKIHVWNRDNQTRMLMVPQPDDQLNGVLIFDPQHNPLTTLTTANDVLTFFQQHFPIFGQRMSPEEAEAFLQRPVGRVLSIRCDRFHLGDRILLIGDAAHAVSPSIGQGCNASLEDVQTFQRCLDAHQDDWSDALPAFSQQRVPDAHALSELSDYSFPRNKRLVAEFFLRLMISRLLHRWFPQRVKPFVFDLILDADLPYSQVLKINQNWINKVKRSL